MFRNYIKTAYRNLLRNKVFTFINIAGLTFGLTACLLIALFVRDEQQYDRFIEGHEQVYRLYTEQKKASGTEYIAVTAPMYATSLQNEFPEVEATVRVMNIPSKNLLEVGEKQVYQDGGVVAEASFFEIFPVPFVWGSYDKAAVDPSTVFISDVLAEKLFGPENPVGKEVSINKDLFQVKGVFKTEDVKSHLALHFILPFSLLLEQLPATRMESWGWQQFYTYVKLKEGTNAAALQAKLQTFVESKLKPMRTEPDDYNHVPLMQPLANVHLYSAEFKHDMAIRGNITYVRALSIIAIFILLIACFNFINLATARSLQRAREVGVRKSIGASRGQLVAQFLIESVLLAFISIVLTVALTFLLLPWLNSFTEKNIQFDLFTNPLMPAGLLSLMVVVGLVAGFYPALVLSGFQPVKVLKGAVTSDARPGRTPWLRHSLVVVQFALSILLIISALVVYRQVEYLNTKDLGFNKEQIMFFPMRGSNMTQNYETFKNELQKVPGVTAVSIGYGFPGDAVAGDDIIVPRDGTSKEYSATQLMVDYDYITTLGLELVAGRDFLKEMKTDADKAFIINETAVKDLGFDTPQQALGQPLHWSIWGTPDSLKKGQVIGVVKDFHYKSLYDRVEPAVLQIYPSAYWKVAVKMRSADASTTLAQVKTIWNQFSPEYPIDYGFLDENFNKMYKAEDRLKSLLWIFTGLAIFVGCLGLFGLAAYAAELRTKEIGIRKVLGASPLSIVLLLSTDFVKLVLIAIVIASPVAWFFMQQWLQDFAYRIDLGWWVFVIAGFSAITIALITVSFHAIRAALRNPVKNLRTE